MPVGRLVRTGLVGGIAVIYVALVGLLAKVAEINLIGTQVTGARAVLAVRAVPGRRTSRYVRASSPERS